MKQFLKSHSLILEKDHAKMFPDMARDLEAEKEEILRRSPFTRALVAQSPHEMREFEADYMAAMEDLERSFANNLGTNWKRIHLPPLIFAEAGFEAFQIAGDPEDRAAFITYLLFSGFELGMGNIDLFVEDIENSLRGMNVLNSTPKIMIGAERIPDFIRTTMKIGAHFRRYTPNAGGPLPDPKDLGNPT